MHTVPLVHMAADDTHTRLSVNTSTPDRYRQPACQRTNGRGERYPPRTHADRIVRMYMYICIYVHI